MSRPCDHAGGIGHVILVETPGLAPVAFEYDARGRLITITEGAGAGARISRIAYNRSGYVESTTDPMDRTTGFEYDQAGRVITEILPDGRRIPYTYDAHGNVTSITPPGRLAHTFTYTPVDLEEAYNPPPVSGGGTNQTRYDYNLNRQVIQITRPDGKTVGFAYDTMGRLVTVSTPEGEIGYVYDAEIGNLTDILAADGGALSYTYDGSLLTGVGWQGQITGSVGYEYDNDFRVKALGVNGSQPVEYGYDEDGLLTGAGGLVLERDPANGMLLGTQLGEVADEYTYNALGEMTDYVAKYGGSELYHVHQEMDGLGRITRKVETVLGETHTYEYGYDQAGRLVDVYKDGVLVSHYDYDPNGNRLAHVTPSGTSHGTYDDQDRMLSFGDATYEYTANGELLRKIDAQGITHYTYDVLGNLTSVVLPDGTRIEYVIDGQNRRIGKKVNGMLVQGFLYQDGLEPIAEVDGAANVVARYLRRQPADLARLFAVILALNLYYQIMIQYWQPILAGAGMARRASFFSAAFIGILLVQSAAGAAAVRTRRSLRSYSPFWLALAASGCAVFAGVGFRSAFPALGGLLLFFFGYRASSVLLASDLQARLPDWIRATYPSVLSTVLRVGLILVYPLVGWGVNRARLAVL